MDIALLIKAAILGIVEGLTEFLPISSTGHLILASSLLGFRGENVATFEIAIQTGAMLAVIWEYRQKLIDTVAGIARERTAQRFALNVIVAFLPAVVFGLAFGSFIKAKLFHPVPVATAFLVGGLIILWVEARHRRAFGERDLEGRRLARVETVDDMTVVDALKVGLVQCLAHDPGHEPVGRDDHRRDAVRPVAARGHRVQLLPRDPDADRRGRVLAVEAARPPDHGGPAAVRRRVRRSPSSRRCCASAG